MSTSAGSGSELTFLALGDSYTIGEGVPEPDRWGMLLAGLLRDGGIAVTDPLTIAQTGWTTSELATAIAEAHLQQTFDLVSLLIGVNNQYRGQPLATFQNEFVELLNAAIRFANYKPTHVLVLSIPDWGATPFAEGRNRLQIAKEIDTFNQKARSETEKAGARFTNITPLTRTHGSDPAYLAPDGLHYAGNMHLQWAKLALPLAQEILS